ncbi:MAG: hypothetical protein ACH346_04390 [Chthoniobacterales bacterium]
MIHANAVVHQSFQPKNGNGSWQINAIAQPQNNFQKPSRTHWICHGLLKIIFRLSSNVNFLTPITVFSQ